MIHKSTKYGNVENVTVAEFGNGTISITNGGNDNHLSLVMKTIEKNQIGTVIGGEISSDEFKPELAIVFTNKESFQVFYEFVQNVAKDFTFKFSDYGREIKSEAIARWTIASSVTINVLSDSKLVSHTFTDPLEITAFIDEFFRTASEDEEIYIAE